MQVTRLQQFSLMKLAFIVATVRGTAFDPVAAEGGSAAVEAVSEAKNAGISKFVAEEIVKSERQN